MKEINGDLSHDAALPKSYIGPGATWANEMNFGMNHTPGAGSFAQPDDLPLLTTQFLLLNVML